MQHNFDDKEQCRYCRITTPTTNFPAEARTSRVPWTRIETGPLSNPIQSNESDGSRPKASVSVSM